jgi:hypothetical protein
MGRVGVDGLCAHLRIGEVSHAYFKAGRGIAPEDLKSMCEKIYKRARAEKDLSSILQCGLQDRCRGVGAALAA